MKNVNDKHPVQMYILEWIFTFEWLTNLKITEMN